MPKTKKSVEEIAKLCETLSDEEKKELQTIISADDETTPETPPAEDNPTDAPSGEDVEMAKEADMVADGAVQEHAGDVLEDIQADQQADAEGEQPDYAKTTEDETELIQAAAEDIKTDAAVQEAEGTSEQPKPQADDIPQMERSIVPPEEAAPSEPPATQEDAPPVVSSDGDELPVDYKQIVEAQNAKIMALEAENKQLKTKVEGAFGFAIRPSTAVKSNELFGDTTDIPPMRR